MGSVKKIIDPGASASKKRSDERKKKKQGTQRAARLSAEAKDTAQRRSQRRRSIYGYGGIFGAGSVDSEAVIRTKRLLGTA